MRRETLPPIQQHRFLIRMTNVRSVVVTMLVGGTSKAGRFLSHWPKNFRIHPEASLRSGLVTSSSTAIVRVFWSRA